MVGGNKSDDLNVELNLTSMIDLMSVLVSFLLMTAVWYQVAAIQSSVDVKGRAPASSATPQENQIGVQVTGSGYRLTWPGKLRSRLPTAIPLSDAQAYDLEQLKQTVAAAMGQQSALTAAVSGDDKVAYGHVAEAIDAVRLGGVQSVGMVVN